MYHFPSFFPFYLFFCLGYRQKCCSSGSVNSPTSYNKIQTHVNHLCFDYKVLWLESARYLDASGLFFKVEYFVAGLLGSFIQSSLDSGFPDSASGKNLSSSAVDVRDVGSVPGLRTSPGGRHGNPLHYSCLENPMD